MRRSTLIQWLLGIGVLLWLSSMVAESRPSFTTVTVLLAVVFSAFAVRSSKGLMLCVADYRG